MKKIITTALAVLFGVLTFAAPSLVSPNAFNEIYPGGSTVITVSGAVASRDYLVCDENGSNLQTFSSNGSAVATTTLPLPEGTYYVTDEYGLFESEPFVVRLHEPFRYLYPGLDTLYLIPGGGGSVEICLRRHIEMGSDEMESITEQDAWYERYWPLEEWITEGHNPRWCTSFEFDCECDEGEGCVALTISASANEGTEPREAVLGICNGAGKNIVIKQNVIEPAEPDDPEPSGPMFNPGISTSGNWIAEKTLNRTGGTAAEYLDIYHFDGLGYPSQDVFACCGGNDEDVIKMHTFDGLGRESKDWLNYAVENGATHIAGEFDPQASLHHRQFNALRFNGDGAAYGSVASEFVPSGRPLSEMLPGEAFHRNGHYSVMTFFSNRGKELEDGGEPFTADEVSLDCIPYFYINESDGAIRFYGFQQSGIFYGKKKRNADGEILVEWSDAHGRKVCSDRYLVSAGDTTLARTMFLYDCKGNLSWVLTPEGYNRAMDEVVEYCFHSGRSWTSDNEWLEAFRIDRESAIARKWSYLYDYDGRQRMVSRKEPGRGRELMGYDNSDRLSYLQDSIQRALGLHIEMGYDCLGRLVETNLVRERDNAVLPLLESAYDAESGLKESDRLIVLKDDAFHQNMIEGSNNYYCRHYSYDSFGRLSETSERPEGNFAACRSLWTKFKYDLQGNIIEKRDSCISSGTTNVAVFDYEYDARSRKVRQRVSVGGVCRADVRFSYDELGKLYEKTYGTGSSSIVERISENEQGRLSGKSSSAFAENLAYSYGGKVSEQTVIHGGEDEENREFFYDSMGRLVEGWDGEEYTYDLNSSIRQFGDYLFVYDGAHRTRADLLDQGDPVGDYSVDGNGNYTEDPLAFRRISWNIMGLPASIIDADSGEDQKNYMYLQDGTLLSVSNIDFRERKDYAGSFVFDRYEGETLVIFDDGEIVNGNVEYFLRDHLGSVRTVVGSDGAIKEILDYSSYGDRIVRENSQSCSNDYAFVGKEVQGSYLNFGARLYSPSSGIFLSKDPLSEKYYGINSYLYCAGDPVTFVDIDGLVFRDPVDNPEINNNRSNALYGDKARIGDDRGFKSHQGFDYAAEIGTLVYAVQDGTIYDFGVSDSYGVYVEIEHNIDGETLYTFYAHLSDYCVMEKGDVVSEGDVIGLTGKTGNAANEAFPHLHFELRDIATSKKGLTGKRNPNEIVDTKFISQDPTKFPQKNVGVIKITENGEEKLDPK